MRKVSNMPTTQRWAAHHRATQHHSVNKRLSCVAMLSAELVAIVTTNIAQRKRIQAGPNVLAPLAVLPFFIVVVGIMLVVMLSVELVAIVTTNIAQRKRIQAGPNVLAH